MKTLNWLPITERIKLKNIKIIHNSISYKSLKYIYDLFTLNNRDSIQTRQNNGVDLKIARPTSEFHRRALSIYGPSLYNTIPVDMRKNTYKNFSKKMKQYQSKIYYNNT